MTTKLLLFIVDLGGTVIRRRGHLGNPGLLEIGASAGLHLRFDHYRYEAADLAFGDPASSVRFAGLWEGTPPFDAACTVAVREGCDVDPVNPATEEGRLTVTSLRLA